MILLFLPREKDGKKGKGIPSSWWRIVYGWVGFFESFNLIQSLCEMVGNWVRWNRDGEARARASREWAKYEDFHFLRHKLTIYIGCSLKINLTRFTLGSRYTSLTILDYPQWFFLSTPFNIHFFNSEHSTSFSLSYSTLIQLLPSPMVFHSTLYPTTFYFFYSYLIFVFIIT